MWTMTVLTVGKTCEQFPAYRSDVPRASCVCGCTSGLPDFNHSFGKSLKDEKPASMLIMGNSFVNRLEQYMVHTYGADNNLFLDGDVGYVQYYGMNGLTADHIFSNHLWIVDELRPDIVYFEVGGDDLCDPGIE